MLAPRAVKISPCGNGQGKNLEPGWKVRTSEKTGAGDAFFCILHFDRFWARKEKNIRGPIPPPPTSNMVKQ